MYIYIYIYMYDEFYAKPLYEGLPVVWTHEGFCKSLDLFMHEVKAQSAHIYGCGLGGFLAQAFAMEYPRRVESLALTNTFCDTRSFAEHSQLFSWSFAIAPEFLLKQYLLDKFPKDESDVAVVNAIDFQVRRFIFVQNKIFRLLVVGIYIYMYLSAWILEEQLC